MSGIDELIRETLSVDAATCRAADDLLVRSMAGGRRLRRRHTVGWVTVSICAIAGLVAGSIAVAGAVSAGRQVVTPAHRGENGLVSDPTAVHATGPWTDWPRDRVFGSKPGASFFRDLPAGSSLLGSGTLPDGMQFRFAQTTNTDEPVEDIAGVRDQPLWGDQPGAGDRAYRTDAPYFGSELMTAATYDNGQEDGNDGFWVVIIGEPGTTSAELTVDGSTWQQMQIEHGIAVVKVHTPDAGMPASAQLRLSDADGLYADGPLTLL